MDDLPSQSSSQLDKNEVIDSDSDDEGGNPLVANFHEEPEQSISYVKEQSLVHQVKVNPLAKSKSKSSTQESVQNLKMNLFAERKSSVSSDEIDVPTVMKIADSAGSNDEFDSWINGTTDRRRSPEGVEDNTTSSIGHPEPVDKIVDDEKSEKRHKSKKKKEKKEKSSKEPKKEKKKET